MLNNYDVSHNKMEPNTKWKLYISDNMQITMLSKTDVADISQLK